MLIDRRIFIDMKRNVDMNQISDGKFYEINDIVKAGCDGCSGCSQCCRGMGNSIVLDPLDIFRMIKGLGCTFEELLSKGVELSVVDGIVLPNIKMNGNDEKCSFLNKEGRCSIHSFRPGICRLFPLGRYYENGKHKYFLQVYECPKQNKSKVKVKNWIDTPDIKKYEEYVDRWHYLLADLQIIINNMSDDNMIRQVSMYVLQNFYLKQFDDTIEIYQQIGERINDAYTNLVNV